jgi:capsular polysaccharide biosynthesis protein
MTVRDVSSVLVRRWWLILLVPAIALPVMLIKVRTQPYQSSFNAIVILPGDTEIPGNSERPELMIMDDVPALISSAVFADAVEAQLAESGSILAGTSVHGTIQGTRYSRVLTVTATDDDAERANAIANAAAAVLADQVNAFLVADPAVPAVVQIIDPPSQATRTRPNQGIKIAALTFLAAGVGAALSLLAHSWSKDVDGTHPKSAG